MNIGQDLLRSRYRLVRGPINHDRISETWIGHDEEDSPFLIKVWSYEGERPDDLQRALWDSELRNIYRVGSSPGADEAMLVVRDAGIDSQNRCFVMVLNAPGYEPLSLNLANRRQSPWLATSDSESRYELWLGLRRIVDALILLHEQLVIHRDVRPETVFLDASLGPSSMRLGGFEWSIRLGTPATNSPPSGWSSPPEFFSNPFFGYRPETDWFAFGMLASRCLHNLEMFGNRSPVERHAKVISEIERDGKLSEPERAFITRLIVANPDDRLTRPDKISAAIDDILSALKGGPRQDESKPLVLVVNARTNQGLVDYLVDLGFVPDSKNNQQPFNPNDLRHTVALSDFIQRELREPLLYAMPGSDSYILIGGRLQLLISAFEESDQDSGETRRTWDMAFCRSLGELRSGIDSVAYRNLPNGSVAIRTMRQAFDRAIRQNARNWEPYLPKFDRTAQLRANLDRFHEFIRCTNQLELLIRDSEIFQYEVISKLRPTGSLDTLVTIKEIPRNRPAIALYRVDGGLADFLQREIESGKPDCELVALTDSSEDSLAFPRIAKSSCWSVEKIDPTTQNVTLRRSLTGNDLGPADYGCLRTFGMRGQVELIRRRKRAIDRIKNHSYLLRSLSSPGQVYMDSAWDQLPTSLPAELVDEAKQAAIRDILRVRPIYALQGPPGTGKTTLVAHLLRQILEDDPVGQVLITAQAHGAVDVLRSKVRQEAFRGIAEADMPLAVRLGLKNEEGRVFEDSAEDVSLRILTAAKDNLPDPLSSIQREWAAAIEAMIASLKTFHPDEDASDFCEVVKRGANITYCTTSAGDLEALSDATQSFDWSIVEEAGKAHGFDLALPLQAGHRWLMIGDHKQLPPYRFRDYRQGIDFLDDCVAALEALPERAANLLDMEWAKSWREKTPEERVAFQEFARNWLNTFERVFDLCGTASGTERLTEGEPNGAAAGILSQQHRMHPDIGDLISIAYYDRKLVNKTTDEAGRPMGKVRHPFSLPSGIESKSIVWVDTPWAAQDARTFEKGRFYNPSEAIAIRSFIEAIHVDTSIADSFESNSLEFAVLSPYTQQVGYLERELSSSLTVPSWAALKPNLRTRRASGGRLAHTVDSFQGNQADVIIVSLARNNVAPPGDGLGFLAEASRINVLLSRAERLLVLVGSWQFFQNQLSAVSLEDPALPLWHWKRVITTLEEWFVSGKALKISAQF